MLKNWCQDNQKTVGQGPLKTELLYKNSPVFEISKASGVKILFSSTLHLVRQPELVKKRSVLQNCQM